MSWKVYSKWLEVVFYRLFKLILTKDWRISVLMLVSCKTQNHPTVFCTNWYVCTKDIVRDLYGLHICLYDNLRDLKNMCGFYIVLVRFMENSNLLQIWIFYSPVKFSEMGFHYHWDYVQFNPIFLGNYPWEHPWIMSNDKIPAVHQISLILGWNGWSFGKGQENEI